MNKDNLLKKTYVANKNNDKYCFHDLKLTTRTDVGPTVNPVDPCWKYVIVASFCAAPPDLAFFRFLAGIIEFVFEVEQKTSRRIDTFEILSRDRRAIIYCGYKT